MLGERDRVRAARGPGAVIRVITDRLARLLKPGDSAYQPGRPADVEPPARGTKLPKGVQGQSLGGRHRKK